MIRILFKQLSIEVQKREKKKEEKSNKKNIRFS